MISKRCCPICGISQVKLFHKQSFILPENHPLTDGYSVVSCNSCGFVFADTIASQKDYDKFYASYSKYSDAKTSTGGGSNPLDEKRLRETAATLSQIIPDLSSRIMDIGCATGGLLKEMSDLGYRALFGIDPSEECVRVSNEIPGVMAKIGSLNQLPDGIDRFNLLVFSHVLEHVQDLETVMLALDRLLDENGLVYIEVPDATHYPDCIIAPFQDFNTEHINHFSIQSLNNLFRKGWVMKRYGQKLIDMEAGKVFPAAYVVFQKAESDLENSLAFDYKLNAAIEEYIAASRSQFENLNIQLRDILKATNSVIVYGTGQLTLKLLKDTCLQDANIEFFVDGNPLNQGKNLFGKPVYSPKMIFESNAPVIIASLVNSLSIQRDITQLGVSNPVHVLKDKSNDNR